METRENPTPTNEALRLVACGEVLWDFLPAGRQLGGAPANFAYHAHALGADPLIVSRVGDDALGHEALARLRAAGLRTGGIGVDPTAPTGYVGVQVQANGEPRYVIHEDVAWDRVELTPEAIAYADSAAAICFGSLAQRRETSRLSIRRLVGASRLAALRIFDINLRRPFYSREIIETSLLLANALKLNELELPILAGMFDLRGEARDQLDALARLYDLRAIALTRGAHGSLLFADGAWSEHPGLPAEVVDTVGAGDAFTATWTLGLLQGRPLEAINQQANEVAAFVCSRAGAMPEYPAGRSHPRPFSGHEFIPLTTAKPVNQDG